MVAIRLPTEGNGYTTTSLLSAKLGLSRPFVCSDLAIIPKMSGTAEMVRSVFTGVFSSCFNSLKLISIQKYLINRYNGQFNEEEAKTYA